MKLVSILGSTGSIGMQTLDVIASYRDRFAVAALAAGRNIERLKTQIEAFHPRVAAVIDEERAARLKELLGSSSRTEILWGSEGYRAVATMPETHLVVSAFVGAAGLPSTYAALEASKDVALANKETMVMAGPFINDAARTRGARIIPIDSEHSAIFQCLAGHRKEHVKKIVLTASGGPLYRHSPEQLRHVTVEEALAHPTWSMGNKISIDSASLMNKGLEVIEAMWLFEIGVERIGVMIHPQSIVHSMVEYIDGSIIAQLGAHDMRAPILYALAYPERLPSVASPFDLTESGKLEFSLPDEERFPCLRLAYRAAREGGAAPAVLNAANEMAVQAFLDRRIRFTGIADIIDEVMNDSVYTTPHSIDDILVADARTRARTHEVIRKREGADK